MRFQDVRAAGGRLTAWIARPVIRRSVGRFLLAAAVTLSGITVWGVVIEPRLIDEVHEEVVLANLSAEWEGRTIAVIADLQIGMWLANQDTIRRIVAGLVTARPAAVLIAGDFIYFPSDEDEEEALAEVKREDLAASLGHASDAASLLRPLTAAGIPTFAVLGNHDYAMMWPTSVPRPRIAAELTATLEGAGIRVLENKAAALHPAAHSQGKVAPARTMYVVGVGPHLPGRDRPAEAVGTVPPGAPRIVFMHNPVSFAGLPADTAPLAIAGHTHGGQIRLPFMPRWSWLSLASDRRVPVDGWARDYGQPGNRLYVNRGIGFSTVPVRINCRPEVTIFTLRSGPRGPERSTQFLR